MNMLSFIPSYEKRTGEKVSAEVVEFVGYLDDYGKRFEKKGIEDIAHGLPVLPDEVFEHFEKKVFGDDPEMAKLMSRFVRICYMDGYKGGKNRK